MLKRYAGEKIREPSVETQAQMRLTKSTSHAIRILIDCARAGDRLIKVAELSQQLDITQQNVFKIVNLLARAGLIEAVRGRNGGVRLARPASEIRIGDVVRASEVTQVEIEDGPAGRRRKPSGSVNRILDDALGAFIDVLDQHTLADMAEGRPPAPPPPRRRAAAAVRPVAMAAPRYRRILHSDC
jgi:Rrf2 family nitric oxide-sensitive transcriptional repressor